LIHTHTMGVDQMCVTTSLHRSKCVHGDRVAQVSENGTEYSYNDFHARVGALAAGLNIEKDDRVAVLALNSFRYTEVYLAVPWADGIIVPLNFRLAPKEIKNLLADCEAKILFVDDYLAYIGKQIASSLPNIRVIFLGDEDGQVKANVPESHEELIKNNLASPAEDVRRGGDQVYGIFYTGGTTGKAKGVMLTHGNITWNALGTSGTLRFDSDTRFIHCAPMFHLGDARCVFASLVSSCTQVYVPRFDPKVALRMIEKFQATKVVLVPTMITMILNTEEEFDLTSLDTINYGASGISETLLAKAMKRFTSCKFIQGYGMTETSSSISILLPEHHVGERLKSVGQPVHWAEAKIVDEKDNDVERGTVGEIVTRGPHVMLGYWKMPRETADALRGGWMHTGDVYG